MCTGVRACFVPLLPRPVFRHTPWDVSSPISHEGTVETRAIATREPPGSWTHGCGSSRSSQTLHLSGAHVGRSTDTTNVVLGPGVRVGFFIAPCGRAVGLVRADEASAAAFLFEWHLCAHHRSHHICLPACLPALLLLHCTKWERTRHHRHHRRHRTRTSAHWFWSPRCRCRPATAAPTAGLLRTQRQQLSRDERRRPRTSAAGDSHAVDRLAHRLHRRAVATARQGCAEGRGVACHGWTAAERQRQQRRRAGKRSLVALQPTAVRVSAA